jgi:four helix bundle protein
VASPAHDHGSVVDAIPSFEAWVVRVDPESRGDPLWRMAAYRMGLYAVETAWADAAMLDRHRITRRIASQLYEAVGSIAANIAEGYSRSSGADRVRIFEYGLGSTRESTVWYRAARPVLGQALYDRRIDLLNQIRRIMLTAIPAERARHLKRRAKG